MVNSPITLDRNWNETIKNVFLLYNGISEQYHNPEVLEKIRSLIPEQILQLGEEDKIKSLLGWYTVTPIKIFLVNVSTSIFF